MKLSVVIPVFNERDNISLLYRQLKAALRSIQGASEIIVVDDGSTDGTLEILKRLHREDSALVVVRLSRNFGQTAALACGISVASGETIVTLDGDLQNDPADIPRLISKLDEGYDLVNGWRVNRQDGLILRRFPSIVANRLISLVTKVKLHDYGCTLKAFRGDIARSLLLYGEMHRFIPALAASTGAAVAEIPVNHRARQNGKSNYGMSRTIRVVLDLLTVKFLSSYATRPIHVFGSLGLVAMFSGTGLTTYLTIQKMFFNEPLANRPLLLLGILLIVVGGQFITMGLLGEMLVRIYHETQRKPIYTVREVFRSKVSPSDPDVIGETEVELMHKAG